MSRDDAYALVQTAAARAWDEGASFRDEIAAASDRLDAARLDSLFDPARFLENLDGVFDRLDKLEVEE
jgi:adenylosuccinate lyase